MARKVGSQSWCCTMPLAIEPALILPGQRTSSGMRKAPSQLVFFSLRNGVMPPSGQRVPVRAVVGRVHDEGVVGDAELVEQVEHLADVLVVVDHGVVIGRLPAPGLAQALRLGVREQVHVRGVEPDEERLAGLVLPLDEVLGGGDELVVAGLHPLLGERAGVLDLLLADPAPARLYGRVVLVGRPGMDHAARAEVLLELREILLGRIVVHLRLFLGIEVIEVAEELVEAVIGRQHAG